MKKILFITMVLLCGCSVLPALQQRKLVSVFHLIETAKYEDAKELVEEMVQETESSQWAKTWYARGLLCQSAYKEGMEKKDKKLFELYPDQLNVAWESYEKALSLDKDGRIEKQLPARYIYLSNEFQKSGERHFDQKRYGDALLAYERALKVAASPLLSVISDTGLVFNAGLAAYEAKDWDKAAEFLGRLHAQKHASNTTHLLMVVHLSKGDTLSAIATGMQGVNWYQYPENLVLLTTDLLNHQGNTQGALELLDRAIARDTGSFVFRYTKGLVLQKAGRYTEAVEEYRNAFHGNPLKPEPPLNIATCYYNIGVEIEAYARTLTSSHEVQMERAKAASAYRASEFWIKKAFEMKPTNQEIRVKLHQLSMALRLTEKKGE
jgi:tetratricopeptide (TPR) repeat protein